MRYPKHFQPPLSTSSFYVLMALVRNDQHGYGIIARVIDCSHSAVVLKPGTLYPLLKRLVEADLVAETGYHETYHSDIPRMHYALTPRGLILIKGELRRLRHAVQIGEKNGLFEDTVPLDIQELYLS